MLTRQLACLSVALAVLSGCTFAPKYSRPAAPIPDTWPPGPARAGWDAAGVAGSGTVPATGLAWAEYFTDPRLRELLALALANNRDLRIAALDVERARALYGIQRAALLPTVDATGAASRERVPADLSNRGERQTTERYGAQLGVAAWEIDFFGRIRSLKDRALEEYLASDQARRGVQVLLVSAVARGYLTLAADLDNLALARTTLESQEAALRLIQRRFDLGLAGELDVHRARTQVESARGDVVRFEQAMALDRNALDLLAGGTVPEALLPSGLTDLSPPRELAAGLPSEVLLERPDVLQSEALLRAAHADIGAARAAFFPRISLTAAVGTASSDLSGLFKAGSGAWSYAPQIVMPIFDARTWSAHRAARVQRELAVAGYERAIQVAFREVADVLAVRGTMEEQLAAQASLVHALEETWRLANTRYDQGIDNYLGVLDAQRSLYAAQQGLVSLQLVRLSSQVDLYAVLGGGADVPAVAASPGG